MAVILHDADLLNGTVSAAAAPVWMDGCIHLIRSRQGEAVLYSKNIDVHRDDRRGHVFPVDFKIDLSKRTFKFSSVKNDNQDVA